MSANPFWDFSLGFYERPGVAEACIALQDLAGLDVNVLLFCIWSAVEGPGRLGEDGIARALDLTRQWQDDVVRPLRAARRAAKDAGGMSLFASAFRRDVAATELAAERVEQWLLYDDIAERTSVPGDSAADIRDNIATFLRVTGVDESRCREHVAVLVRACAAPPTGA